jgi:uncharacterized protein YqeY
LLIKILPHKDVKVTEHMTLNDRLSEDLKQAMKAKDQLRMDTIRMMKAALFNKEIELNKPLDQAETNRVLTTMVKQRKDAADQYQTANRPELAEKELKEIVIVESYLPRALSGEEIAQLIANVMRETNAESAKDMGKVMKAVMTQLAGQAVDGKVISELIRARLK